MSKGRKKMNRALGNLNKEMIRVEGKRLLIAIGGALLYSVGQNMFVVPSGLYSGGMMGMAQIVRTLLISYLHLPLENFDIAGLIYYAVNIPLLLIAMKSIGKQFLVKTLTCVTATTVFLSIIPVQPIMTTDVLASCLIGGICCGFGMGIALKMGGSLGGTDIVGLILIKRNINVSVGRVSLTMNLIVYTMCLFLFNISTVIYSLIYAAISSFSIDRAHSQNINVEVKIITKKDSHEMEKEIFERLNRGITRWDSYGAYTNDKSCVLYILISKYEMGMLKQIVAKHEAEQLLIIVRKAVANHRQRILQHANTHQRQRQHDQHPASGSGLTFAQQPDAADHDRAVADHIMPKGTARRQRAQICP